MKNLKEIKIALTGKMRVGKDTVYKILRQELTTYAEKNNLKPEVHQIAFGDALKEYAEALFPDRFEDGKKPRELFQWFGQTMRQADPDIWVKKAGQKVNQLRPFGNISYYVPPGTTDEEWEERFAHLPTEHLFAPIITDLRQPNEYKYAKENDFYIVKITAPDEIRLSRMQSTGDNFTKQSLSHETESHIDTYKVDFTINNYRNDLDNLKEKVKFLVEDIMKQEG